MKEFIRAVLSREFLWLVRQSRPHLALQLLSVACIAASSWLYLLDPIVMKWLLDDVLPKRDIRGLLVALVSILLIYVGGTLLSGGANLLTVEASQKVILDLRRRLLHHLNRLSADYHEEQSVGARCYLFNEPMEEISQLGADLLPSSLRTIVLMLSVLTAMLILNLRLTLLVLPWAPIFLLAKHKYRGRIRSESDLVQCEQRTISSFLHEHLQAVTQVQLLGAASAQERRAFRLFAEMVRGQCMLSRTVAEFWAATSAVTVVAIVTVLGMGGEEFFHGRLTLGGLVAFYAYLTRLFEPLGGITQLYSRLQRVGASIRSVVTAFDLESSLTEEGRPLDLGGDAGGAISFEQVEFGYENGRVILADLTFRVAPRGRVALVGSNGSGKSTVGKLIARLYDPQSGVIRVDGLDVRKLRLKGLRDHICYLPQHAVLFDGTLRDNLLFGNAAASEQELAAVLGFAQLQGIVATLPNGLDSQLGPGGNQLSGGEKQRVAIARAILRRPRILILDEATSFVDGYSEERILRDLTKHLSNTTIILISHHLSALKWVDEVLVLQSGRIVASGTHAGLTRTSEAYTSLFSDHVKNTLTAILVEPQ